MFVYLITHFIMSIVKKAVTSCPCGKENTITIYKSINIAENPELKGKVKDGSLFLWECPSCGRVNLAKYEVLYHDPAKKLMVWLFPEGDLPKAQQEAISRHAAAMGEYTLRQVSDVGSLMEKVCIFDAGLDDVTLEMCKFVTRMELAAKDTSKADIPMKFYRLDERDGEKFISLTYPDNGQMQGINIGFNVYEDCAGIIQRNPSVKAGEGFQKIDDRWLAAFVR